jgi:outer membrane protein assembly factor BamA
MIRVHRGPLVTFRERACLFAGTGSLAALLLSLAPAVPARQRADTSHPKISQIRVAGNNHFTEAQIVAASGLRVGEPAIEKRLDEAAALLAKTGAFSEVTYKYRARSAGWEADFQVVEVANFLPCTFDNFVWFSDTELDAAVRHEVPLFDGSLPLGKGLQDDLIAALDKYLHAHQIAGSTVVRPEGALGGKLAGFVIRVSGVPMPVVRVEVVGGPLDAAALNEATRGTVGNDYSRSFSVKVAQTALTETYQDEGYLQPKFSEPMPAFQDPAGKDASQGVIVKYQVAPGLRYSWAGVNWMGNQALSAAELTKLLGISPGEVARRKQTLAGWDAARDAFGRLGYLTLALSPVPHYDERAASVQFEVQISEGPQFLMGDLRVDDRAEKVAEQLAAAWKLKRGQVYDVGAEKEFIRSGAGKVLAHAGATRKGISIERDLHPDTRTVNVLVRTVQ